MRLSNHKPYLRPYKNLKKGEKKRSNKISQNVIFMKYSIPQAKSPEIDK